MMRPSVMFCSRSAVSLSGGVGLVSLREAPFGEAAWGIFLDIRAQWCKVSGTGVLHACERRMI